MNDESCGTCKHFDSGMEVGYGVCRRYAPRPLSLKESDNDPLLRATWPKVHSGEYCGEFEVPPSGAVRSLTAEHRVR